jgi:hypothetical protein
MAFTMDLCIAKAWDARNLGKTLKRYSGIDIVILAYPETGITNLPESNPCSIAHHTTHKSANCIAG